VGFSASIGLKQDKFSIILFLIFGSDTESGLQGCIDPRPRGWQPFALETVAISGWLRACLTLQLC